MPRDGQLDLSRIVSAVEIQDVRLREASYRSLFAPDDLAKSCTVNATHDASIASGLDESGSFVVLTNFRVEVRARDDERTLQAEVSAAFELSYQVPGSETFSLDEVEAFGRINAVFNAWPYWRELVQTSFARMSLPRMIVPLYRMPNWNPQNGDTDVQQLKAE